MKDNSINKTVTPDIRRLAKQIANDCRVWREKNNISLEMVAASIGMTAASICNFERGFSMSEPVLLYYLMKGAVDIHDYQRSARTHSEADKWTV